MIACLLIPDLVSKIEDRYPEFAGTPVILTTPTNRVQAASLEAVRQGVRLGMRQRQAQAFCSSAHVRSFDDAPFIELIEAISVSLEDFTSRFELARGFWMRTNAKPGVPINPSGAVYYLDLGKLKRADALVVVNQLQTTFMNSFGLAICVGLASNKFTASAAVRSAQPNAPKIVGPGYERRFLARLPVSLLPLTKEMARRLSIFGIHTLGEFADFPSDEVYRQFGKAGQPLHQLAQGIGRHTLSKRVQKPTECFHKVLDGAVEDKTVIDSLLQLMGEEIAERLKRLNLLMGKLELTLDLDDWKSIKTERVLPKPTDNAKLIGRYLMRLFASLQLESGITEIKIMALKLTEPVMQQPNLFDAMAVQNKRVTDFLEELTDQFGNEGIVTIHELEPNHLLPEFRYVFEKAEVVVA